MRYWLDTLTYTVDTCTSGFPGRMNCVCLFVRVFNLIPWLLILCCWLLFALLCSDTSVSILPSAKRLTVSNTKTLYVVQYIALHLNFLPCRTKDSWEDWGPLWGFLGDFPRSFGLVPQSPLAQNHCWSQSLGVVLEKGEVVKNAVLQAAKCQGKLWTSSNNQSSFALSSF